MRQALFIILNDEYLINEIHEILDVCKVGATTFKSSGLGAVMTGYETMGNTFASLRRVLDGDKPSNVTIMSVIDDDETLEEVTSSVMDVLDNIEGPGIGFMFCVPVTKIYGYKGK